MTFMKKFGLNAVGFSFLITCICIPWAALTGRFFSMIMKNDDYAQENGVFKIYMDINQLLQGDFAAATVLISFGAVIGKITPSQIVVMTILETLI